MPSESIDVVIRFINQGSAELDRVAAQMDRVTGSGTGAARAVDGLEQALGRGFGHAADGIAGAKANIEGLIASLGKTTVVAGLVTAGIVAAVDAVGELYNAYDPLVQANERLLKLMSATNKEFASLIDKSDRLRLDEFERRFGRVARLTQEARLVEGDAKYQDAATIRELAQKLDKKIGESAGLSALGSLLGPLNPLGYFLGRKAQGLDLDAEGLRIQIENAQLQQRVTGETASDLRAKAGEIQRREAEQAAAELAREVERKSNELDALLKRINSAVLSYQDAGLTGLAKFDATLQEQIAELRRSGARSEDLSRILDAAGGERRRQFDSLLGVRTGGRQPDLTVADIDRLASDYARRSLPVGNGTGSADINKALAVHLDQQLRITQATIDASIRLVELTDDEYRAAERVRDIRLATASDAVEARKAELDYAVRIAEIDKQRLDRYKESAGRVFDSLTSGGVDGLRNFLQGQVKILERQLFVNASSGIFQKFGGVLGQVGAASGLGGLLNGTIFDPKNAQQPIDRNTTATELNTRAIAALTKIVNGTGGVPGISDLPIGTGSIIDRIGIFGSDTNGITGNGGIFGKVFGAQPTTTKGIISGLTSVVNGGLFGGLRPGGFTINDGPGRAHLSSGAERIGNVAGSAAAVGLGTLGVISGIREGGARGATGAAASALGVAASIPGPQQPFVMAAALIAGMVRGLLPDPKAEFDKAQTALLNSRRYSGPDSISETVDFVTGGAVDHDYRGRTRIIVNRPVIHFSALDAQSLIDRRAEIAEVVGQATKGGESPSMALAINQQVFGPTN